VIIFILSLPLFLLCFLRNTRTLARFKKEDVNPDALPQSEKDPSSSKRSPRNTIETPVHTMDHTLSVDGFHKFRLNLSVSRPNRSQPQNLPKVKELGPNTKKVGDVVINQDCVVIFNMND